MKNTTLFYFSAVKSCVALLVVMSFSCNEPSHNPLSVNERNVWKDAGMRSPQPVIVDAPQSTTEVKLPDSTFMIVVTEENYKVRYNSDSVLCENIRVLDSAINAHGDSALSGRVALQCDVPSESPRLDSVIDLLKTKKIIRFNLITDLEKDR